jgi:hypothetical protein
MPAEGGRQTIYTLAQAGRIMFPPHTLQIRRKRPSLQVPSLTFDSLLPLLSAPWLQRANAPTFILRHQHPTKTKTSKPITRKRQRLSCSSVLPGLGSLQRRESYWNRLILLFEGPSDLEAPVLVVSHRDHHEK